MTMFRSGPPDSPNAIGQFNTARGGTRFRSASGWDGEWNVPSTNNDAQQGGIPSLAGSMGVKKLCFILEFNLVYIYNV